MKMKLEKLSLEKANIGRKLSQTIENIVGGFKS